MVVVTWEAIEGPGTTTMDEAMEDMEVLARDPGSLSWTSCLRSMVDS